MVITEIPSSKIYEKTNQKIIKNKYTGYSFSLDNVKQAINLGSSVYTYESDPNPQKFPEQRINGSYRGESRHILDLCDIEDYWAVGYLGGDAGFVGLSSKWCSYSISFPDKANYDLIKIRKVYTGVDDQNQPRIHVSISYKKTTQKVGFYYRPNSADDYNNGIITNLHTISETTEDVDEAYNIPEEYNKRPNSADSTIVKIVDSNNVNNVALNYDENTGIYSCTITLQDYVRYYNQHVKYGTYETGKGLVLNEIVMNVYTHIPNKIKITFYGDKTEDDIQTETFEYNINDKNVLKIDSNEIMQTNSLINGSSYVDYVKNGIMNTWADGLETAEITCSISDYNDYITKERTKSISELNKEMLFKNGDVIIPMVATPTGDKPMSKYSTSSPKLFMVMSNNIVYDGALWQKLVLQEYQERYSVTKEENGGAKIRVSNIAPRLGETVTITVEPLSSYKITKVSINGVDQTVSETGNKYTIICESDIKIYAEAVAIQPTWHVIPIQTGRYATIGNVTYEVVYAEIEKTAMSTTQGETKTLQTEFLLQDINTQLGGIDNLGTTRITAYVDTTAYGSFATSSGVTKKLLVQDRVINSGIKTNTGQAIATTGNKTVVNSNITGDNSRFIFSIDITAGDGEESVTGYGEASWVITKIEQYY